MDLYGFLWILVWNLYEIVCMDTFWRFGIPLFCVESLFGLVVVLNRGKFYIDKMLGFRGDAVRFFSTHVFVLAITWSSLIQIE